MLVVLEEDIEGFLRDKEKSLLQPRCKSPKCIQESSWGKLVLLTIINFRGDAWIRLYK